MAAQVSVMHTTRLSGLDAPVWDTLTRDASLFMQRRYLSSLESVLPASIEPLYAIVLLEERPVMALSAQVLHVTEEYLDRAMGTLEQRPSSAFSRMASAPGRHLRGALLRTLFRRVLICGSLYTTGIHGFACEPGARLDTVSMLDEALAQLRQTLAGACPIDFTVIKDTAGNDHAELSRRGYRRCPSEPEMMLEIDPAWKTYTDYISAVRSRYRRAARHLFDRCERADAAVVRLSNIEDANERLYDLYQEVERRARIRVSSMPPGFLPGLCKAAGAENFRCSTLCLSGELVGFVASVKDRDTSVAFCAGFDYRALRTAPIYLRLLHAALEDAIEMGCARLSLGRMAYEPKARLGAKPLNRWIWMRHRYPLLNTALTPLLNRIPLESVPVRHVFRKT